MTKEVEKEVVKEEEYLDELSNFIFTNKYARYNEKLQRRETWEEAVKRVENMHIKHFSYLSEEDKEEIRNAFDFVREKKIAPSMRCLQFGGKAIEAHQLRTFNCSVRHIDSIRSFAEVFYALLCGTGVGIGVSKKFLDRLPDLVDASDKAGIVMHYTIEDTMEGWADSIEALLMCYFRNTPLTGRKITFDYSQLRPKGAPLKTGGGKAPGYKGLKQEHLKVKELLDHIIEKQHQRRLNSVNVYDILMHCADAVLSGGIRRSATCVVFDKNDIDMVNSKTYFKVTKKGGFEFDEKRQVWEGWVYVDDPLYKGMKHEVEIPYGKEDSEYKLLQEQKLVSWLRVYPQRARSNNSILLIRDKITKEEFCKVFEATRQQGEPGFVFGVEDSLFNPCFEICAIPVTSDGRAGHQHCNLTTQNGSAIHSVGDFYAYAKAASIIGTLQAAYTTYPYLSNATKELTEEEALLGVSITGIMDNPDILLNPVYLIRAAFIVKETNEVWAKKLGINPAARTTCIKPEGTSSLVLKSASGAHPHEAHKYLRRVQVNKLDPVYKFFKKQNPHMCEESVWSAHKTDDVIAFPVVVPEKAMVKSQLTAIQHLEIIKLLQQNWVIPGTSKYNKKPITHNVSCTILVGEDEWEDVMNYLYENREYFAAVSLLPKTRGKIFLQLPLEEITDSPEDQQLWNKIISEFKHVDFTELKEDEDATSLQQELVCAGGQCEMPILSNE